VTNAVGTKVRRTLLRSAAEMTFARRCLGWSSILIAALAGHLSPAFFFKFSLSGILISIGSVLLEEMTYHRYDNARDFARLLAYCFLEFFPYRPLNTLWRLHGLWDSVKDCNSWVKIDRVGFAAQSGPGR